MITEAADTIAIYVHTKRPQWGLAILCNEVDDKLSFQFQDGQTRTIGRSHIHLMEAVDRPLDVRQKIVAELSDRLEFRGTKGKLPMSYQEQLQVFKAQFAEGFSDPEYRDAIRGEEATKRRKGHRSPTVTDAAEVLAEERLKQLIDDGNIEEFCADVFALMGRTNLVSIKRDRQPLAAMSAEQQADFAAALFELLYGKDDPFIRFVEWNKYLKPILKSEVSWPMATLFLAIRFPQQFVYVKPTVFRDEAKWSMPRLKFGRVPDGNQYRCLCEMTGEIQERLVDSGFAPRDMLDVYEFIWCTRRPKGVDLLKTLKQRTASAHTMVAKPA